MGTPNKVPLILGNPHLRKHQKVEDDIEANLETHLFLPCCGGVPEQGYHFWGPYKRIIICSDLYWGPLILGNYLVG